MILHSRAGQSLSYKYSIPNGPLSSFGRIPSCRREHILKCSPLHFARPVFEVEDLQFGMTKKRSTTRGLTRKEKEGQERYQ